MTVGELVAALARYPADYEVRMRSDNCCSPEEECDGHDSDEINDARLADGPGRGLVVMLHW